MTRFTILVLIVAGGLALMGCRRDVEVSPTSESKLEPTPGVPWLVDVAGERGIDFRHFDSATPHHYIQETMGSGIGWIDFDGDGWPDLFCVQDGPVRPGTTAGPTHKLYRNNGDGTFTDVTAAVGLDRAGYGMGCAVGDFDNDGFDDLLVTYFGGVALFHNEPGGPFGRRFVDVTAKAGLSDPHWATSAAWGDIDGDGFLDLYVCNYVEVDLEKYPNCADDRKKVQASCPPTLFACVAHRLFKNNGNGTFTDISVASGIAAASPSPGLGVVMTDVDGDGKLDIYVANDLKPAFLFHNQGGGKFVEKALYSGCAFGPDGSLVAGMGVEAGDIDDNGRPALFVTNFQNKPNVLYRNRGNLLFQEFSLGSGLGGPSIHRLGFGTVFSDLDLDGRLDIAVANGHIHRHAMELLGISYGQRAQLFLGTAPGKFRDVSAQAGPYFRELRVGRGLAAADFDNDGRPDLAFSHCAGTVALLHNRTVNDNNWIRLELIGDGVRSNRNAVGARVEITSGGRRQVRFINGGGSYLSASERRLTVGLGSANNVESVAVTWPSGRQQEYRDLAVRKGWRLREGNDKAEEALAAGPRVR
jgi:enediyne biosynthesis protein E4